MTTWEWDQLWRCLFPQHQLNLYSPLGHITVILHSRFSCCSSIASARESSAGQLPVRKSGGLSFPVCCLPLALHDSSLFQSCKLSLLTALFESGIPHYSYAQTALCDSILVPQVLSRPYPPNIPLPLCTLHTCFVALFVQITLVHSI